MFRSRRHVHVRLGILLTAFVFAASTPMWLRAQSPIYTFLTLAGRPAHGSTDGLGSAAGFFQPQGVTVDANGVIFVADSLNHVIRRIGTDGVVSTVAGLAGSQGATDGLAGSARFNKPIGVVSDGIGTVYVTDQKGVRKIAPDGTVSTVSTFVSGPAVRGIVMDSSGNLFVAAGHAIIKIVIATGVPAVGLQVRVLRQAMSMRPGRTPGST